MGRDAAEEWLAVQAAIARLRSGPDVRNASIREEAVVRQAVVKSARVRLGNRSDLARAAAARAKSEGIVKDRRAKAAGAVAPNPPRPDYEKGHAKAVGEIVNLLRREHKRLTDSGDWHSAGIVEQIRETIAAGPAAYYQNPIPKEIARE